MDTFAALNKLGNLHAVTYHRNFEAPDVLYTLAWDERSQNKVCLIIFNHIKDHNSALIARGVAAWIAQNADEEQGIDTNEQHDWCYGYAYVTTDTADTYFPAWLDPVQQTAEEYTAILSEGINHD